MRAIDAIFGAIENLLTHKLRSVLTMLGMMFGVGAVIAMLAIGAGAERQALELVDRLGVRNIVVRAKELKGEELEEARKKSLGLSLRDVRAIEEALPEVQRVSPLVKIEPYQVQSGSRKADAVAYGVSKHHIAVENLMLGEGRFFDRRDEAEHAQVCVIGAAVRQSLFGAERALGRPLKVDDVWLTVVGVLAPESSGGANIQGVSVGTTGKNIYIPIQTVLSKFDQDPMKSPLEQIVVRLAEVASAHQSGEVLETLLDRLHGGARDYELIVPEVLLEQSRQTQRIFNIVMGCIAGISLLVGGIGIMNIMLASVLEQTREIGVRRAVGALRRDIRFQFLVEAISIALLGGLSGVAFGVAIARMVASYAGWPTVVTALSIVIATGVSSVVGLVSGIYPAIRASRLDPIEALQHQ
jgi:putative ABC transport system permease protein